MAASHPHTRTLRLKNKPAKYTAIEDLQQTIGHAPSTALAESTREWKRPRIIKWRVLAAFYSFIVVGAIGGAYGVCILTPSSQRPANILFLAGLDSLCKQSFTLTLHYRRLAAPILKLRILTRPQFGKYYDANYLTVSFILLAPLIGYNIAAFANSAVHHHFGQLGIAFIGPGLHVFAFFVAAQHPPYPVLVLSCALAGLGNGLVDVGWNAWIGGMENNSGIMGALHACYGLGAALAPVVATAVISREGGEWYHFYYLMVLLAVIELCASVVAFWLETGEKYREQLQRHVIVSAELARQRNPILQALSRTPTWLISVFIFIYAGIESSLADWILTFLVDSRHQSAYAGSFLTFGYWAGLTLGRIVIGFCVPSSKKLITLCLASAIAMHSLFSFNSGVMSSAVAMTLVGFSLGPIFPGAIIMQTKLLSKELHVAAVGFSCALGSVGGCVLPFLVGAAANGSGIWVLSPFIFVALIICLGLWIAVPVAGRGQREEDDHESDVRV